MKTHVVSVHEGKKPFKCDICDYNCSQKSVMNRHVASVHQEKKPFKCNICDYSCFQKKDMKKHIASVHEGKKPFKCDICDYSSSQKGNLKTHVASFHEEKKPTFDFQGKISHVFISKNQKQNDSNANEESDSLNNFEDVEQNLDDDITIKEEWNVFDQELVSY